MLSSVAPRRSAAAVLAGAVLLGAVALATPGLDRTGRLTLAVLAAFGAVGAAVLSRVGPAVTADADSVVVLVGVRRRRLDWSDVAGVRADERRRSRGLELDLGEELVVVPAYLLGERDLRPLAAALEALRTGAGAGAGAP